MDVQFRVNVVNIFIRLFITYLQIGGSQISNGTKLIVNRPITAEIWHSVIGRKYIFHI